MDFITLKEAIHLEIIGDARFSWLKILRRIRSSRSKKYIFWFRVASYLHTSEVRGLRSLAKRINKRLIRSYGVEIMLGAKIGKGLKIIHPIGIVVWKGAVIGSNLTIRQNTTIGTTRSDNRPIVIGDNVNIGANTCIIGDGIRIGDNVKIGAMSYVGCDVPDDCTFVTVKESRIIKRTPGAEPFRPA